MTMNASAVRECQVIIPAHKHASQTNTVCILRHETLSQETGYPGTEEGTDSLHVDHGLPKSLR